MNDPLGDRIKSNYEDRTRYMLPRRTYTVIRLDGRAFHTFTAKMQKPFDKNLINCMNQTTLGLCREIAGCFIGYTQSDEISLVLFDGKNANSEAFFDGNIQKIASIAASKATAHFNRAYYYNFHGDASSISMAEFDARVFTIPDSIEVANYLIWRQNDSTRNSIQMVAQANYSHKDLQNKKWDDLNEMLFKVGINFNDYDSHLKRGRVIVSEKKEVPFEHPINKTVGIVERNFWNILPTTPWFTKEPDFLKNLIPRYE